MNDSAVGQYYDAQPVLRGQSITITLALGRASPSGLTLQTTATAVAAAEPPAEETTTVETATETVAEAPAEAPETAEETVAEAPAEAPETAAETVAETPAETVAEAAPAPDRVTEVRTDLVGVNALLRQIDALLAAGSAVTEEELTALERSVAALKERVALYGTAGK